MPKISIRFLILFCLIVGSTYADGGTLTGKVFDTESNEPIYGASITLRGTDKSVMSGTDGEYVINNIKPDSYTIIAQAKGYFGIKITDIEIVADSTTKIDLYFENRPGFKSGWKIPSAPPPLPIMITNALPVVCMAFDSADYIPIEYTCDGQNISPEFRIIVAIKGVKRTQSMALICDDPDAPNGDWVHWVMFNIPPLIYLSKNVEKSIRPDLENMSQGPISRIKIQPIQGINDFGRIGYDGPCPPIGPTHRYFFKFYALDKVLEFNEEEIQKGITKAMLLKAMEGHILSQYALTGRYKR